MWTRQKNKKIKNLATQFIVRHLKRQTVDTPNTVFLYKLLSLPIAQSCESFDGMCVAGLWCLHSPPGFHCRSVTWAQAFSETPECHWQHSRTL